MNSVSSKTQAPRLLAPLHLLCFVLLCLLAPTSDTAAQSLETELKGVMVRLADFGRDGLAYLSLPDQPPIGGIVLVHSWWGLNETFKRTADTWAQLGFVVLAVDLANGRTASTLLETQALARDISRKESVASILVGETFLRESPRFRCEQVAFMGWGVGADLAFAAAAESRRVRAVVMWDSVPEPEEQVSRRIRSSILILHSQTAPESALAQLNRFESHLKQVNRRFEINRVPAPLGFSLNPASAQQAGLVVATNRDIRNFLVREFKNER